MAVSPTQQNMNSEKTEPRTMKMMRFVVNIGWGGGGRGGTGSDGGWDE